MYEKFYDCLHRHNVAYHLVVVGELSVAAEVELLELGYTVTRAQTVMVHPGRTTELLKQQEQ